MDGAITKPRWSFSSIKLFDQCPKKYFHLRVSKDYQEPESDAMLYGTQFHQAAEDYVKGTVDTLDLRFSYAQALLDKLKNTPGEKLCEYEMALTADLEPCAMDAENVWWRGIADLVILSPDKTKARVYDYKTGKSAKYADTGQLELMALALFKYIPTLQRVKAGLLFVVSNELIEGAYSIDRESELWRKWLMKYAQMVKAYNNDVWNPRPTGLCRAHCIVLECPHNGRR